MTARSRPQWADAPYPVTPEEVAALFRVSSPPYPSAEHCTDIAKALSHAMPAHYRRVPGLAAFARYHVVYPKQLAPIMALRQAIKRRRKVGPDPWFHADWQQTLDALDHALTAAAPILAGPDANDPPERHWHRIGWNVAEMARMSLDQAGHTRSSASRHGRVAKFTAAALTRIGIMEITPVAVERMHARMRKRLEETDTKEVRP